MFLLCLIISSLKMIFFPPNEVKVCSWQDSENYLHQVKKESITQQTYKPQSVVITLQFGFKQEMHIILWALEIGRPTLHWPTSAVWSDCSQSLFWALAAGLFVMDRHDISFELLSARKKISTLHQMLKYTYRSTVFSLKTAQKKCREFVLSSLKLRLNMRLLARQRVFVSFPTLQ